MENPHSNFCLKFYQQSEGQKEKVPEIIQNTRSELRSIRISRVEWGSNRSLPPPVVTGIIAVLRVARLSCTLSSDKNTEPGAVESVSKGEFAPFSILLIVVRVFRGSSFTGEEQRSVE